MRSLEEVEESLALLARGHTPMQVARLTGIPRPTIRDWSYGRTPQRQRQRGREGCPFCGVGGDVSRLDPPAYAYLLGIYLGDGCVSLGARGVTRLRVTLDAGESPSPTGRRPSSPGHSNLSSGA
jgi:hypothetical protein